MNTSAALLGSWSALRRRANVRTTQGARACDQTFGPETNDAVLLGVWHCVDLKRQGRNRAEMRVGRRISGDDGVLPISGRKASVSDHLVELRAETRFDHGLRHEVIKAVVLCILRDICRL